MSSRNPVEYTKAVSTLKADSYSAASTNGTAVDTKGYRKALVVLNAGTAAASAEADVSIETSADNSTWAALSGASFAQITTANDETVYVGSLDCDLNNRYVRAVNAGDGTNAVALSVTVVLLDPEVGPAAQTNTVAFTK